MRGNKILWPIMSCNSVDSEENLGKPVTVPIIWIKIRTHCLLIFNCEVTSIVKGAAVSKNK